MRSIFLLETIYALRRDFKNIGNNLAVMNVVPEYGLTTLLSEEENTHNIIVYQKEICNE